MILLPFTIMLVSSLFLLKPPSLFYLKMLPDKFLLSLECFQFDNPVITTNLYPVSLKIHQPKYQPPPPLHPTHHTFL